MIESSRGEAVQRFRVVPAAYVVLRRRHHDTEQILLQLRRNTGYRDGYWATAAAGHVEAGESVVEAACREAAEELGIAIDPDHLVPVTTMHRTGCAGHPDDERVDFFFECRRWQGQPRLIEPHKAAALEWFDLDDLPERTVPHELDVLGHLRRGALRPVLVHGFGQPNSSG